MMQRKAKVKRTTKETDVSVALNVDGSGQYEIATGIPFLNHMLESFSRHGFFDLRLKAKGDLHVDYHHTVEDVGLTLGEAFRKALGQKKGIKRFGQAMIPLDEALTMVAVDLSGRPYVSYGVKLRQARIGDFATDLPFEFFRAFANQVGMNLHIHASHGENAHHIIESCFKGLARAMDEATQIDARVKGVLSTKGKL
jgi:imidazoleglycerol-phosphate dehydratase